MGLSCFIREAGIKLPVFFCPRALCEDFTNDAKAFLKMFKALHKCVIVGFIILRAVGNYNSDVLLRQ